MGVLLLYETFYILSYMTAFVKKVPFYSYIHYVKLCIDITQDGLSIDWNMQRTCKVIKLLCRIEVVSIGTYSPCH